MHEVTMPMGKYKGQKFCDLPDSYFDWAQKEGIKFDKPKYQQAYDAELAKRRGGGRQSEKPASPSPQANYGTRAQMAAELVKRQFAASGYAKAVGQAVDAMVGILDAVEQVNPAPTDDEFGQDEGPPF